MIRRMLCLLCAAFLLTAAVPVLAEGTESRYSYDFDLAFSLNAESFPPLLRSRASGYAALVNRLGLKGHIAWDNTTRSMDMSAVVYYTDDNSLSFPFRIFGAPERVYITSPLINNETIFLNMPALMEFSVKAKNTLNVPLTYLAFLYPNATEYSFSKLVNLWRETIGSQAQSGEISNEKFAAFSDQLKDQLGQNPYLQQWIRALAIGAEVPGAVEAVFSSLPSYYHAITNEKPVSVSVSSGSEIWQNSVGQTIFSRQDQDHTLSLQLSLPPEENGYSPLFSFTRHEDDQCFSFDLYASCFRDQSTPSADSGEYAGEDDEESYSGISWPDSLLLVSAAGSGLPLALPADSSFSLNATINGAVYPNYSFTLQGESKKDGSVSLSLYKPFSKGSESVLILGCSGTILPAEPESLPNYLFYDYTTAYNVFSFNEITLPEFRRAVLPSLIRSIFSFVAAAPTSACQSFLDDLTDMGILDMFLD